MITTHSTHGHAAVYLIFFLLSLTLLTTHARPRLLPRVPREALADRLASDQTLYTLHKEQRINNSQLSFLTLTLHALVQSLNLFHCAAKFVVIICVEVSGLPSDRVITEHLGLA